jgi:hypothetical protein
MTRFRFGEYQVSRVVVMGRSLPSKPVGITVLTRGYLAKGTIPGRFGPLARGAVSLQTDYGTTDSPDASHCPIFSSVWRRARRPVRWPKSQALNVSGFEFVTACLTKRFQSC